MTNGYEATIIYRSPDADFVHNHAQTLHRRVLRMRKIMGEYLRAGPIAAQERAASNKTRHNRQDR
jgi:hypothetical protein